MTTQWQTYREPLRTTLLRTSVIAIVLGGAVAFARHRPRLWPTYTLFALWITFGGHWVELAFLNFLRPRLPLTRFVQILARLAIWFLGGVVLFLAMRLTAIAITDTQTQSWPAWWIGGAAFIGIELVVHAILQLRRRPSFFNGRG